METLKSVRQMSLLLYCFLSLSLVFFFFVFGWCKGKVMDHSTPSVHCLYILPQLLFYANGYCRSRCEKNRAHKKYYLSILVCVYTTVRKKIFSLNSILNIVYKIVLCIRGCINKARYNSYITRQASYFILLFLVVEYKL